MPEPEPEPEPEPHPQQPSAEEIKALARELCSAGLLTVREAMAVTRDTVLMRQQLRRRWAPTAALGLR